MMIQKGGEDWRDMHEEVKPIVFIYTGEHSASLAVEGGGE
jgi:hypothetical protein